MNLQMETVARNAIEEGMKLAAHPQDACVFALAIQTGAEICSLDSDFFSEKITAVGVKVAWPCNLIWDLSVRYMLNPHHGTIVIGFRHDGALSSS